MSNENKTILEMIFNRTCMDKKPTNKEFFEYFEGKENLDDAIEKLKKSTRHYAKRQITWFKNKLNCHYLEEYNNVSGMVNEIISDSKILEK